MNRFRPFRNVDPPKLADLWNRGLPRDGLVHELNAHDLDALIAGKFGFDPQGFLVAENELGQVVGFVHAAFGPNDPEGARHDFDHELGTIAMLVVDSDHAGGPLPLSLVDSATAYLKDRGAKVIYAGGQAPLNPFYWGLYGGSEFSGILSKHQVFRSAVVQAGFEPVSTTLLFESDLAANTLRDPKGILLRRQTSLEVEEDAKLPGWWSALALGEYRPTYFRLVSKTDSAQLASAWTWEMTGFSRDDRRTRLGLTAVEVLPAYRRKGFGRHLVGEILRRVRGEWIDVVSVQTAQTNSAAVALYQALNFDQVESATLYRLPGP